MCIVHYKAAHTDTLVSLPRLFLNTPKHTQEPQFIDLKIKSTDKMQQLRIPQY